MASRREVERLIIQVEANTAKYMKQINSVRQATITALRSQRVAAIKEATRIAQVEARTARQRQEAILASTKTTTAAKERAAERIEKINRKQAQLEARNQQRITNITVNATRQRMIVASRFAKETANTQIREHRRAIKEIEQSEVRVKRAARDLALALVAPLAMVSRSVIKSFASLDKAMVDSTSIMLDSTSTQRQALKDLAQQLSTETLFSATEIAQSYRFLASAGLNTAQTLEVSGTVARFAQAGMFDLEEATRLLADANVALGESLDDIPMEQIGKRYELLASSLVKANTLANASVQQFSRALTREAAAVGRAYGLNYKEIIALLGAFAAQNVKGELAGRSLGRVFRLLNKAVQDNAGAFRDAGIEVFDANGEFRLMKDILFDMEKRFKKLSPQARGVELRKLGFTARVQQVILPLIGTDASIGKMMKELENVDNLVTKVSDARMESLSAQLTLASNKLDVLAEGFGKTVAPELNEFLNTVGDIGSALNTLPPEVKRLIVEFMAFHGVLIGIAVITGGVLVPAIRNLALAISALSKSAGLTKIAIAGLAVGITILATRAIASATRSLSGFNKALEDSNHLADTMAKREESKATSLIGNITGDKELSVAEKVNKLTEAAEASRNAMMASEKQVNRTTKELDKFGGTVKWVQRQVDIFGGEDALMENAEANAANAKKLLEARKKAHDDINKALEEEKKKHDNIKKIEKELSEATGDQVRLTESQRLAIDEVVDSLQKEIDAFGLIGTRAELAAEGVTVLTDEVKELINTLERKEGIKDAVDLAKQLTESTRTPGETFARESKQIELLSKAGLITAEVRDRALKSVTDKFNSAAEAANNYKEAIQVTDHTEVGTAEDEARVQAHIDKLQAQFKAHADRAKATRELNERLNPPEMVGPDPNEKHIQMLHKRIDLLEKVKRINEDIKSLEDSMYKARMEMFKVRRDNTLSDKEVEKRIAELETQRLNAALFVGDMRDKIRKLFEDAGIKNADDIIPKDFIDNLEKPIVEARMMETMRAAQLVRANAALDKLRKIDDVAPPIQKFGDSLDDLTDKINNLKGAILPRPGGGPEQLFNARTTNALIGTLKTLEHNMHGLGIGPSFKSMQESAGDLGALLKDAKGILQSGDIGEQAQLNKSLEETLHRLTGSITRFNKPTQPEKQRQQLDDIKNDAHDILDILKGRKGIGPGGGVPVLPGAIKPAGAGNQGAMLPLGQLLNPNALAQVGNAAIRQALQGRVPQQFINMAIRDPQNRQGILNELARGNLGNQGRQAFAQAQNFLNQPVNVLGQQPLGMLGQRMMPDALKRFMFQRHVAPMLAQQAILMQGPFGGPGQQGNGIPTGFKPRIAEDSTSVGASSNDILGKIANNTRSSSIQLTQIKDQLQRSPTIRRANI